MTGNYLILENKTIWTLRSIYQSRDAILCQLFQNCLIVHYMNFRHPENSRIPQPLLVHCPNPTSPLMSSFHTAWVHTDYKGSRYKSWHWHRAGRFKQREAHKLASFMPINSLFSTWNNDSSSVKAIEIPRNTNYPTDLFEFFNTSTNFLAWSRSISRILSSGNSRAVIIYLDPMLPSGSCDLPKGYRKRAASFSAISGHPLLLGLAPDRVYQASRLPGNRWALT